MAQRKGDRAMSAATAGGGADLGAAAAAAAKAQQGGSGAPKRKGGGGMNKKRDGVARWLGGNVVSFEGARLSVTTGEGEDDHCDSGGGAPEDEAGAAGGDGSAAPGGCKELVLLDGFSYDFTKGERVVIIGRNGAGKTSFLRALVGDTPLSDGRRTVGETVRFGYYDQRGLQTTGKPREKVLEYVVSQVGGHVVVVAVVVVVVN